MVIVRFAPSPTGHLHIGGARTALFNYLFARHHKGKFLLRIEDTDRERSTQEFLNSILKGMEWLGMEWDGEPISQAQRVDIHREHVEKLLQEGKAYRCYCTPQDLEKQREALLAAGKKPKYPGTCREKPVQENKSFCIRFKASEEGSIVVDDLCRGRIEVQRTELDDLVLLRSDGTPTYNLTVVVDDVLMKITHVIRGDDHINNTPRQIQLYEAFNYPIPKFAHLPMILGPDKKKLSKRHGDVSVVEYQEAGFLPEAMLNYLARLGWSHGDQEIFTKKELIEFFDLDAVGKAPAVFDIEKCTWVNSQHMLKLPDEKLAEAVLPYFAKHGIAVGDKNYATRAIRSEREKGKTLKELAELSAFYFRDEVVWDSDAVAKWLNEAGKKNLRAIQEALKNLKEWNEKSVQTAVEATMQNLGIKKMVEVAQPCRVALTGSTTSPGIYEVIAILGRERTIQRMEKALAR